MAGFDTIHLDIKPGLNPLCGSVRFLLEYVVGQYLVAGIGLLNQFVNIFLHVRSAPLTCKYCAPSRPKLTCLTRPLNSGVRSVVCVQKKMLTHQRTLRLVMSVAISSLPFGACLVFPLPERMQPAYHLLTDVSSWYSGVSRYCACPYLGTARKRADRQSQRGGNTSHGKLLNSIKRGVTWRTLQPTGAITSLSPARAAKLRMSGGFSAEGSPQEPPRIRAHLGRIVLPVQAM